MTTKHKHIVLSIEDKINIYEYFDKGSSMRQIVCEYIIAFLSISCTYICLIIHTFDYLNKPWSQGGQIIDGAM